jgi:hypothetical protein
MPEVRIIVFENVTPGYCVVTMVLSAKPSKLMVLARRPTSGAASRHQPGRITK